MTTEGAPPIKPSILVLGVLTALLPTSTLIVVPSITNIQRSFSVDYGTAQLVITSFLVSVAVSQLIVGPLSDHIGRRPVILAGVAVYVVASAIGAVAWTIEVLIAARALQALGSCAGLVVARAMIRDSHSRQGSAGAIANVSGVMVVSTMLAPAIGGFLETAVGWQGAFWFMLTAGAIGLALSIFFLPETHLGVRVPLRPSLLLANFTMLLGMPSFVGFALTMSFATAIYYAFLSGGTQIAIDILGLSPRDFGIALLVVPSLYLGGNLLTARLARRVRAGTLILSGTIIAPLGLAWMAVAEATGNFGPYAMFGGMGLVALGNGLVIPSALAYVVSARPDLAGAASGLAGTIQYALGGLVTVVVGAVASANSAAPVIVCMFVLAALSLASYLYFRKSAAGFE